MEILLLADSRGGGSAFAKIWYYKVGPSLTGDTSGVRDTLSPFVIGGTSVNGYRHGPDHGGKGMWSGDDPGGQLTASGL